MNHADKPFDLSQQMPISFTEVKLQEAPVQFSLAEASYGPSPTNYTLPGSPTVSIPAETSTENTSQISPAHTLSKISIEAKGYKITVDASYPTDKLTLLLRELMRS